MLIHLYSLSLSLSLSLSSCNNISDHACVYNCRISDEEKESEAIAGMLKEKGIKIKYDDHKMLKYYTVKVEGLFKCICGKPAWSSYMATVKVDLYLKCLTRVYKQACKKCKRWVTPSFLLEDVMERVIAKYYERKRSLESGCAAGDHTLVDSDARMGSARGPHEQSLCERCQELGKPCWG